MKPSTAKMALDALKDYPTKTRAMDIAIDTIEADLEAKAEPYGWTVSGCNEILRGQYAESGAKSDAARCGGTASAIALYTDPRKAESMTPDRAQLQAEGKHPAPCARHCEAQAFSIEIRRLTAERDALRADADRYRWLRNSEWEMFDDAWLGNIGTFGEGPDELDAAIDAARATSRAPFQSCHRYQDIDT